MKIKTRSSQANGEAGVFSTGYSPDFCCQDMRDAWETDFAYLKNISGKNDLRFCLADIHPWPSGAYVNDRPISFCPWCGQRIKILKPDSTP